jgi:DNA-binding transcriptional MerR regulator
MPTIRRYKIRAFPYITVGKILEQLRKEGVNISRSTFYILEKAGLFASERTIKKWRRYTKSDAEIIKRLIKENYGIIESAIG